MMNHSSFFQPRARLAMALTLLAALCACGGGGGSAGSSAAVSSGCQFTISSVPQALTAAEVETIIAQAVQAAVSIHAKATVAVVDRSGNVLAVFKMTGAADTISIGSRLGVPAQGLEALNGIVPSELAAIAKSLTGAYLSSSGNAFSTRTASYIIQNHFAPEILQTAGGPLFGVQFSQLPCGDFVTRGIVDSVGPKRSPLGLSADPGGFPLYKNGRVVGGIGVMADAVYGLDKTPSAGNTDIDERIAQSAGKGFEAPSCIRAERITAGGLALPYTNADAALIAVSALSLRDVSVAGAGQLSAVATYYDATSIRAGQAFGTAASGFVADASVFQTQNGYVLSDSSGAPRYAPSASQTPVAIDQGGSGLSAAEVTALLQQALGVANQARAQIRSPQGSAAQVSVSVVDLNGKLLGLTRTPDAPVFGTDVSLQKARTAVFFSSTQSAAALNAQPALAYLGGTGFANGAPFSLASKYVAGAQTFFNQSYAFADGTAFSARAIGNIARPNFPDGIDANSNGPLAPALSQWSVFNDGLQLDLIYSSLIEAITQPGTANNNCSASGSPANTGIAALKNGIQIFPGGFPIYRGNTLIAAIGVSGDGVDQDDMIAFLGVARAAAALHSGFGHAPAAMRIDSVALPLSGLRLRYAQCPQAPFNASSEQNVCDGL
ncbi:MULTISPECIES: heme-binding protein [unclassified Undibacterium]|uniref:heme-binding protein n=1 Tax=unclassified Undibacterium TaxID=2630295 RepID=UPI002AC9AA02|nr:MULTISPECIES: heme-binding protein [unclassified Undibacterium]MEB0140068.1 heme-binding protein [Undibacterium sp. CCC2.1]MEB0173178.1 heme-binding protein [Undibacterium sp. CCC1.1]MEB0176895.1 heme-binding protein [Undibacterium sp. CCC3.4]MEB0216192.1 heme-binding protein [Undibacterium sp. 5I2]WPX41950.1 heme-binding protein [Undibacterium sp. CCC3.4]